MCRNDVNFIAMKWLRNIALNLIDKKARKTQRKVRVHNLQTAKTIGIIYDATSRSDDEKVLKLVRYFKEERKKVKTLGFIDTKKPEEMPEQKNAQFYFNKKALNIIGLPKKSENQVSDFMNEPFDVLINLDLQGEKLPLLYVYALSKASFKISAAQSELEKYADFMIDVSQNNDISFFSIQLKHYLKLINKKTEEYEHV